MPTDVFGHDWMYPVLEVFDNAGVKSIAFVHESTGMISHYDARSDTIVESEYKYVNNIMQAQVIGEQCGLSLPGAAVRTAAVTKADILWRLDPLP
jgi:hypothetical protein